MYAVCPGGEGADLKSVELKGFAGSNPVCSAFEQAVCYYGVSLTKKLHFFYLDNKSTESARSADTRTPEPKWMFELF